MRVGLNLNTPVSATKNFKGLWGKTTQTTDIDQSTFLPKVRTTTYYYPFKEEKQKDIDSIIKENSGADLVYFDKEKNKPRRYNYNVCKQAAKLPFTEVQYQSYYNSRNLPTKLINPEKMIDEHVKELYKTNQTGLKQKKHPARNPELIKREQ